MKYTSALIYVGRALNSPDTSLWGQMTFYPEDWYYGSETEVRIVLDDDLWSWLSGHLRDEEGIRIIMGSVPSMWHVQLV